MAMIKKSVLKKADPGQVKKMKSSKPVFKIEKREPRRIVEEDWYVAKMLKAEVKDSKPPYEGQYVSIEFELVDSEDNVYTDGSSAAGLKLSTRITLPIRVGRKSHVLLSGIVGHELAVDEEIDMTPFYGHKFRVFVENGKHADDDGTPWQNIAKIKQIMKKKVMSK